MAENSCIGPVDTRQRVRYALLSCQPVGRPIVLLDAQPDSLKQGATHILFRGDLGQGKVFVVIGFEV